MKKIITILLLVSIFYRANGQNVSLLDQRNGFKSIHIGDDISKYASNLTYVRGRDEKGYIVYSYLPNNQDILNIFNFQMENITLTFNRNDKLNSILLVKYISYEEDNNHMQSAIEISKMLTNNFWALFGKPTSILNTDSDSGARLGSIWCGKKILTASYINYLGVYTGTSVKVIIDDAETSVFNPGKGF